MMKQSAIAAQQFGDTAAAYLSSSVHASGADLDAVSALAARHAGSDVLDLGCGAGHVSFAAARHARSVTACDVSENMLQVVAAAARERGLANISTVPGRAEALPFADASFDIVITRFSAHHWSDVRAALREAHRVLKPQGKMRVIDIVAPEHPLLDTVLQTVELLRDASHVRDYRVSEWEAMLAEAGFTHRCAERWRLKMVFADWIARMRTPPERTAAIRSVFAAAAEEARAWFAVDEDDSFSIDAAMFEAAKRAGAME
jgi:ubiquinone/menaquinone biosynthesis C-methylase UbiE